MIVDAAVGQTRLVFGGVDDLTVYELTQVQDALTALRALAVVPVHHRHLAHAVTHGHGLVPLVVGV